MQVIGGKLDHPEVRIETTNRCNAMCVMCPREKMTRPKMDMPLYHFKGLVNQVRLLGVQMVSVFGYGEPLMDGLIFDKIRYCTDMGLETFITTNAGLLDVEVAKVLLDAGLTHIRFSVHAIKDKDYERIHRGLNAKTKDRNIWNFIAINRGRCKVHVTCMPLSGENVEDFKKTWEGVDYLEVWKPHNWAGGRKFRRPSRIERGTCQRAFTGPVQILADGRMVLCCFDYDGALVIGNTHEHTIEYILQNSLELKRFRRKHETHSLKGLICEGCDQRFLYEESPLLYSNEQEGKGLNKTSITKFDLVKGEVNGLHKAKKAG